MKTVDIMPLKTISDEYRIISLNVSKCYRCDWDDQVHESFRLYVSQIEKLSDAVQNIYTRTQQELNELDAMNIDDIVTEAERLCREADSI